VRRVSGAAGRVDLAQEPDFVLGPLAVSPSSCRVIAADGETRVEAQTMSVLIVLARAEGATVSRDQLVEACWQGRVVSDDAIARSIAKVRALAAVSGTAAFILQTISKVGYRLLSDTPPQAALSSTVAPVARRPFRLSARNRQSLWLAAGVAGLTALSMAVLMGGTRMTGAAAAQSVPAINSAQVFDTILTLDENRLQAILKAGWNPNWHLDTEGNASLHILMEVCTRNRAHDKAGVVRIARQLLDAGADPTQRNKWADTPLIIASTPRYCGPNHPVVALLRERLPRTTTAGVGGAAKSGR
jgi:DNA-binding winged helix-turn-helix (wHTH) protein